MNEVKITSIFDKYSHVEELSYEQNGKIIKRERIIKPNAVCAVVFDTVKKIYIFVKQYRPGCNGTMIEVVAGKIDDGEDPQTAIIREIEEETGYKTDKIKVIQPFYYSSPGYSTERLMIFYAEVSEKVSDKLGIDDEAIELVELVPESVHHWMKSGKFVDGKTIMALLKEEIYLLKTFLYNK